MTATVTIMATTNIFMKDAADAATVDRSTTESFASSRWA